SMLPASIVPGVTPCASAVCDDARVWHAISLGAGPRPLVLHVCEASRPAAEPQPTESIDRRRGHANGSPDSAAFPNPRTQSLGRRDRDCPSEEKSYAGRLPERLHAG